MKARVATNAMRSILCHEVVVNGTCEQLFSDKRARLIEASALGKPVIGSAAPGIDEVIAPELTGLLVEPGSAEALAGAIERLIGDGELRRRMGEAGRERVEERFTLGRMVDATEALYYELLDARRGR